MTIARGISFASRGAIPASPEALMTAIGTTCRLLLLELIVAAGCTAMVDTGTPPNTAMLNFGGERRMSASAG